MHLLNSITIDTQNGSVKMNDMPIKQVYRIIEATEINQGKTNAV